MRFIPVDTGNTKRTSSPEGFHAVHPRGYGEHKGRARLFWSRGGSSPWIRGTHQTQLMNYMITRFIPVDTGNTHSFNIDPRVFPVHPRGYGEHGCGDFYGVNESGSSPWIRGTLNIKRKELGYSRFIPVDTGNTFLSLEKT